MSHFTPFTHLQNRFICQRTWLFHHPSHSLLGNLHTPHIQGAILVFVETGFCLEHIHGAVTSFSWPLFDCRPFLATQTTSKPSSQSCEKSNQDEVCVISCENVTITKRFVEVGTDCASVHRSCFDLLSSHKLSDVSYFHSCCIIIFNVSSHSNFISICQSSL